MLTFNFPHPAILCSFFIYFFLIFPCSNLKVVDDFKISFWAKNIFDERYAVRGFYFGLIPPNYEDQLWISYGDPKQFGVSLEYNFDDSF